MNWWDTITALEKVLYIIASTSTLILIIQTILAIFGIGDDSFDAGLDGFDLDVDAGGFDFDSDFLDMSGIQILTIRGVMSFFAIGGWSAIVCLNNGLRTSLSLLIGLVAGLITMFVLAKLMQLAMRLQSSGNINIDNTVGKQGVVYLVIPPKGSGQGKVTVVVQERLREFQAITEADEGIPTGAKIEVKGVLPPNILVVEKI